MRPSGNPDWSKTPITTARLKAIEDALKNFETVDALPANSLAGQVKRLSTDGQLYLDTGAAWLRVYVADANGNLYVGTTNVVLEKTTSGGLDVAQLRSLTEAVIVSGKAGTYLASNAYWTGTEWHRVNTGADAYVVVITSSGVRVRYAAAGANPIVWTEYKSWHEGNDGSGSGLDADTLDGEQLTQIKNYAVAVALALG